ncbi:predicted protein [Lichtheimia corymbifera JMRC:FSU:9682]|uniref:Uncharacterized protein n=1 Tax=Lichtheimia corymbifera JMRC:FSU:9682 TaxID=1263082 RepID=A0A068RN50_9FUNG|nr:predicted protein [Lichtheimia corymbifera JMRC:FSU:9682]
MDGWVESSAVVVVLSLKKRVVLVQLPTTCGWYRQPATGMAVEEVYALVCKQRTRNDSSEMAHHHLSLFYAILFKAFWRLPTMATQQQQ